MICWATSVCFKKFPSLLVSSSPSLSLFISSVYLSIFPSFSLPLFLSTYSTSYVLFFFIRTIRPPFHLDSEPATSRIPPPSLLSGLHFPSFMWEQEARGRTCLPWPLQQIFKSLHCEYQGLGMLNDRVIKARATTRGVMRTPLLASPWLNFDINAASGLHHAKRLVFSPRHWEKQALEGECPSHLHGLLFPPEEDEASV